MENSDCIFCKIAAGEVPVTRIYEDEDVLAFLDTGPVSDGHTLLIPRCHFCRLDECAPVILEKIAVGLGIVASAVSRGMECDGYNILCNNGRAAGQLVEHLHWHIIPRNDGDGVFAHWPSYKYEEGKMEEIAARIKASF